MFRFEEPAYLYLLLLLPFLAAFYLYSNYRRRRNIRRFGDPELLAQLMPDVSKYRPDVKFWLIFAAIGLFSVLLARPQFGSKQETVKRKGVEVIIALDISNSMLAQDVQPSRLEKAKRLVSRLVDELDNDKVGMIVFAGDAFTQLPITSDYISAKMFLESISPSLISKQGTAIGEAINLATRSFTPQEGVGRAIIVITDGENHEGGAVEAAKAAAAKPEDEKLAKAAEVAAQAAKDAADGTKIPETFKDYLQKYVYGCKDQDDLLNVLGGARLMNLKNEPHLGYSTRH